MIKVSKFAVRDNVICLHNETTKQTIVIDVVNVDKHPVDDGDAMDIIAHVKYEAADDTSLQVKYQYDGEGSGGILEVLPLGQEKMALAHFMLNIRRNPVEVIQPDETRCPTSLSEILREEYGIKTKEEVDDLAVKMGMIPALLHRMINDDLWTYYVCARLGIQFGTTSDFWWNIHHNHTKWNVDQKIAKEQNALVVDWASPALGLMDQDLTQMFPNTNNEIENKAIQK